MSPAVDLCAASAPSEAARSLAEHYAEHGYVIARSVVGGATLAELTRDFHRVVAQVCSTQESANARWNSSVNDALDPERKTVVVHTHQIHQFASSWARFCFNERFVDACAALLGEDVVLHHSKLFLKPAGLGAPFPPHQDWTYFPARDDQMLAAVVALSDCDEDNGCIRVWPGSHKLGRLDHSSGMGGEGGGGGELGFAQRFPFSDSVPAVLAPGDVLFFNYLTVHGSLPNSGSRDRASVLFQLHGGRDAVDPGVSHPNSQLVLRGWNHAMRRSLVR
ncbi:phytanoyl-CoA dioxygenase family protein [Paucibacter sp. M5-1]|uniref:phytanoyl-CoA dioxygenase family protein n=1 Tax=Paucibacter sp. M5-1 TaxID=3015998 RepID=UPI0022B8BAB8|nr:phytanoyl-CoA dioxygenase family protein [Paucibacter sp. M5-1]MCZ7883017.1 phytanoyl-CoA dioxygenase family protein [Paucibacter sp. M5-1]